MKEWKRGRNKEAKAGSKGGYKMMEKLERVADETREMISKMDPTTRTFKISVEHCNMDEITPHQNNTATGHAIVVRDWGDRLVGLAGIADDIDQNGGSRILFYAPRRSSLIVKIADKIEKL